jgi:hypothetical protein
MVLCLLQVKAMCKEAETENNAFSFCQPGKDV